MKDYEVAHAYMGLPLEDVPDDGQRDAVRRYREGQTRKWEALRTRLDNALRTSTSQLDQTGFATVPLMGGLALARTWLDACQEDGDWDLLLIRLSNARKIVDEMTNEGRGFAQFGLWDGLNAALSWADQVSKETADA